MDQLYIYFTCTVFIEAAYQIKTGLKVAVSAVPPFYPPLFLFGAGGREGRGVSRVRRAGSGVCTADGRC